MIPKEQIDAIRQKTDIIAVVSPYVALKKSGRNYVGLCPFHSEKGPSFTVSQEKQLFHCFGCGEGGNVFDFLMKIESLGFAEAAAELGARAGINVEQSGLTPGARSDKEKIYEVMALAAKFFRQCFLADQGAPARAYLEGRGITAATAEAFGLGYAPNAWDQLFKHLIGRGAAPALIERAGLILPREGKDGYYDRFRHRLLFPVHDTRGRPIAFSGRALDDGEPKYLNSPETPVYHKGATIYGLNFAKDEMKRQKKAILVEGNLDLVTLHQAGFRYAAAPLGTALTPEQCKLLARFTDTVMLAYDADPAGETAAERSAQLLRSQELKVKVISFSGAKDPDEFIRRQGAAAFQKEIDRAIPYLEFRVRRAVARHNTGDIEGKSRALREICPLLAEEKDPFIQGEYAKLAAALLAVVPDAILGEIKRQGYYQPGRSKDLRRVTEKPPAKLLEAEKKLIALSTQSAAALAVVKKELAPDFFSWPDAKAIAEVLFNLGPRPDAELAHAVTDNLSTESARNFLTQVLVGEALDRPDEILNDCIGVIKAEHSHRRVSALKTQLHEAEQAHDAAKAAEILAALKTEIS
ncbi:MAG: DNA primase [Candidatus Margulisiibacteriota bacterium]